MTDTHPIRIWKQDKNWGLALETLRKSLREGKKKFGEPIKGLRFYEIPVNIDPDLVDTFLDLQGLLYKQQIGSQLLGYFLRFWDDHRQMFSFDPVLADSLHNTEVSQVPWSEIRLPHSDFHVTWGDFGQESFWGSSAKSVGEFWFGKFSKCME